MSKKFTSAGIDGREARAEVFLDENGEKVKVPKAMSKTFTVGKHELTVKYRIGKKFETIREDIGWHNMYDPEEAVEHILSKEEVLDRLYHDDPNCHSDAFMFVEEELDTEGMTPLDEDDWLDRMAWFAAVCNRLANEQALEQIVLLAPKKKDGTFAKNRVTVVASCPLVSRSMGYYQLVGKPKNDTQLDVTIQSRRFSKEAATKVIDEALLIG